MTKVLFQIDAPSDYRLDAEDKAWIEHIIQRAANRGSGLEDTEAVGLHQEGHKGRIDGANAVLDAIRSLAGAKFADGEDTEATKLRALAKQLDSIVVDKLKRARAQHEELFILSYQRTVAQRRAEESSQPSKVEVVDQFCAECGDGIVCKPELCETCAAKSHNGEPVEG